MASAPQITISRLLRALVQPGRFRVMRGHDFDAFAGASEGSLICDNLEGDLVIVGPPHPWDQPRDVLSVHAYRFSSEGWSLGSWVLRPSGWEELEGEETPPIDVPADPRVAQAVEAHREGLITDAELFEQTGVIATPDSYILLEGEPSDDAILAKLARPLSLEDM